MSESIVALLARMPKSGAPGFSEAVEALEAFVEADKAHGKAHDAWRVAEQRLLARREALERVINEAGRERDGLETIIPEVNPVKPGDRFTLRDGHDPVACRDGDHYGQCSGVTR